MLKIDKLPRWAKILVATLMMCVLGPLSINMQGYTPITLQSLGVILFPMIFGWKEGTISILLYVIIGSFGVPVFADFKGGISWLSSPSAGFLLGFIPVAAFAGIMAERTSEQFFRFFLIFLASHVLLLFFGFIGLLIAQVSFQDMMRIAKYLLPGMFIKSFIGGVLVMAVKMKSDKD